LKYVLLINFRGSQGKPTEAEWMGENVQVETDKGKTFLVKDSSLCEEI